MEDDSGVLFVRGNEVTEESDDDDVWDDTALIEAYDRAVSLAKEEVQRRMGLSPQKANASGVTSSAQDNRRSFHKKEKKKNNQQKKSTPVLSANGDQWKLGMPCQSLYHEDGILYEAVIENLSAEEGICKIKFVGYENTQICTIDELLPSEGRWAQKKQIREAKATENSSPAQGEVMDWSESNSNPVAKDGSTQRPNLQNIKFPDKIPFSELPPPPPLSQFTDRLPGEESEALSSMLMSWYLNGFHTGYYLGLKQGKEQSSSKD